MENYLEYFNIYLLEFFYLLECCYIQLRIFSLFSTSLMVVFIEMDYQYVFSLNLMNNSTQLKDREMKLLVLLFLIILEMRSSAALECATCVCFLSKLWILKKIYSKFVEPWEMKKLPWDRETIWHKVKLWELETKNFFY